NFRTRLCTNFSLGHCSYENQCQFAHVNGGVPHCRGFVDQYKMIEERKICRMYYNGNKCSFGGRCRFLHVRPEGVKQDLGPVRESSKITVRTTNGISGDKGSGLGGPVFWKTKLCRNWEMMGVCPYGKICYFAHGQAELQKCGGHFALNPATAPTNISTTFPIANNEIETGYKQQVQAMESLCKWKELGKIIGIYADWIEDMPFLHCHRNKS
ncbi:zf-CCCH domain-containing protein, partial [Cephalotus follicularis]